MRKMLRGMAKFRMTRNGTTMVNKRMSDGRWRQYVNAYPMNTLTGAKMPRDFVGTKNSRKHTRKHAEDCRYSYC